MQPIPPFTTATPPPPRPIPVQQLPRPGVMHLALFFASIAWYRIAAALAASAANGFAVRLDAADEQPLIEAVALLFMVLLGLAALRIMERTLIPFRLSLGIPKRPTAREEWTTGAALGWGVSVISAMAMVLARSLHVQFWTTPHAFVVLGVSATALAITTLAKLLALYGYGFQHLVEGTGAARATALLLVLVVLDAVITPTAYGTADGVRVLVSAFGALLLCLCWLRTRALWLGWGGWFGWSASTALIFGLPVSARFSYSAVVDARASGHLWLTGGNYGPAASVLLAILFLAAIPLLVRLSDEYAWRYTRKPLVPGGIAVEIPAPAAHATVEPPPPPTPSLVQIQPLAPSAVGEDAGSS